MKFFQITYKDKNSKARTGIIQTDHGIIETPDFMPVGTQATVKTLSKEDLNKIGAQIILANTYHLHLRPTEDLIAKFGGLHKFMNWDKPILTDSGGFQVFSLGLQKEAKDSNSNEKLVSIDDEGVTFKSHLDGSTHHFTPEKAINIQHKIGADIIMAFDECTPDRAPLSYARQAMDRTHKWAVRCIVEHKKNTKYHGYQQFIFGIIQGANHEEMRKESAKIISEMDFDGIAIGGESIGYNMEATKNILNWISDIIPENKPHYTMGVGFSPSDLFDVVERGVDMFDCVAPTRVARNGRLFVHKEINKKMYINISNAEFKEDVLPIDPVCKCFTCQNHSRAYLYHLFKAGEMLAFRLASVHNLYFFLELMRDIRKAIKEDRFNELKKSILE